MRRAPVLSSFCAIVACLGLPGAAHAHAVEGELSGVHADYFDDGFSDTHWRIDTGDRSVPVLPTELPALAPEAADVEMTGKEADGTLVGAPSPASAQAAPASGGRKLAVIVFNFEGDTRQPWTPATVRQRIFTASNSTSAFFREETHDRIWLTGRTGNLDGDVFGYYTLPAASSCSYTTWASQAKQAAVADGFSAALYQHVMYVFPTQSACGWAGLAYMPGTESWINGELTVRVTGHELGHNLGLNHAASWDCTSGGAPVTLSPTCTVNEYNDPFDNMGAYGHRHSHGWNLQRLGVLQPSNVQTIDAPGVYSMTSALEPTDQPNTLRIPRTRDSAGNVVDWYYLEVRERGGVFDDFALSDPVVNGVSIRVDDDPSRMTRSKLLDTHPGSGGIANAPLAPGETFRAGDLGITTLTAVGGDATVQIAMGGGLPDTQPPSAPGALVHSLGGGAVRLAWSASSDDTGVSGYQILRDGVQVASTQATSFEDATAAPGPHVYTVYADDAAGNRSPASAPHVVIVPAHGVVGRAAGAAGTPARRGPVIRLDRRRLAAGAVLLLARARDLDGVKRMALFIDGRRVSRVSGARLRFRWGGRRGSHRAVVVAVDGAGNRSALKRRLHAAA